MTFYIFKVYWILQMKRLRARKQVQVTTITANEVLNKFYKNNIQRGIHLSLFSIDRLRHE